MKLQGAKDGRPFQKGPDPRRGVGRKGRSGRKPDEFKAALERVRDTAGLPLVERMARGEMLYTLTGTCEHCGQESTGPDAKQLLRLLPSAEACLRAAELTMKYTVGLEKTIRLEGFPGAQRAFEVIKARTRAVLPPEIAEKLLADFDEHMKGL
jgi:hypothetical protein